MAFISGLARKALPFVKSSTTANSRVFAQLIPSPSTSLKSSPFSTGSFDPEDILREELNEKISGFRIQSEDENMMVMRGSKSRVYIEHDIESLYVRFDLPGVKKEDLKIWVENHAIHFEALETKCDKLFDREIPRKFESYVNFIPRFRYKTNELKAVLSNGVLKVIIPLDHGKKN